MRTAQPKATDGWNCIATQKSWCSTSCKKQLQQSQDLVQWLGAKDAVMHCQLEPPSPQISSFIQKCKENSNTRICKAQSLPWQRDRTKKHNLFSKASNLLLNQRRNEPHKVKQLATHPQPKQTKRKRKQNFYKYPYSRASHNKQLTWWRLVRQLPNADINTNTNTRENNP